MPARDWWPMVTLLLLNSGARITVMRNAPTDRLDLARREMVLPARFQKQHRDQPVDLWASTCQYIVRCRIIERLVRPMEPYGPSNYEHSVLLPVREGGSMYNYVLRVDPQRRGEVLAAAVSALAHSRRGRIVQDHQTLEEMRAEYYRTDRAMAWLLVSVCGALLVITALGIVGLASFWVQQRTRQIGIRRALGATRGDILRYFQVENFILATAGIVLGMAMAYSMNLLLMSKYEVPRLPAEFLPIGAFLLWSLGQIAVLGPALRASMIPPAIATRTV